MSLNEPSVDFHLKMQEASFRIPYEALKKNFKAVQKLDEKQFKKVDELIKELCKAKTKKERLAKLKQLITSMKQFEKKIKTKVDVEDELMSRIEARIKKLNELKELKASFVAEEQSGKHDEANQNKLMNWYRDQTNILISDYLLKNNHLIDKNPGLELIKNLGFENLIDSDIILVSNKISSSILKHDLSELIAWIADNKSYLKKIKSNLEFETRFQEYIELIKDNKQHAAVDLFKTHLLQFSQSNFEEIKNASGLLVFVQKATEKPKLANFATYSELLSSERYKVLSNSFLEVFYKMHGIPQDDPLLIYLSIGISSLKTRSCICQKSESPPQFADILSRKLNRANSTEQQVVHDASCPVCSLEFQQLAYQLPHSHIIKSNLFENPIMLPNGNIFDKVKLIAYSKTLSDTRPGEVSDPITSEIFEYKEMVTMYPA